MNCLALQVSAQDDPVKKPSTLVFHVFYNDFKTAQQIRTTSFKNTRWSSISDMQTGFGVNYLRGIATKIDLIATLDGSYTDYLFKNGTTNGTSEFLLDANISANIKLLTDNHPVVPYVFAGAGASVYKGTSGFYIPVGLGLQFNLFNEAFVFTNMQYRKAISPAVNDHLQYNIGIGASLGKKNKPKKTEPITPVVNTVKAAEPIVKQEVKIPVKTIIVMVTDQLTGLPLPGANVYIDGPDGKLNALTDAKGQASFDAVKAADYTVSAELHGVNAIAQPIVKAQFDVAADAIQISLQHNDQRFTLAGRVRNKATGMPEGDVTVTVANTTQNTNTNTPDKPDDGTFSIQLESNSDFTVSGKKGGYISNIEKVTTNGLTRSTTLYVNLELGIEQALPDKTITLPNIYYDTGSTQIRANASPDLEKLIKFLNDNPDVKIEIASHTDSRGSKAVNLKLSQARAQQVVSYLQKNGIDKNRLVPKGYGASKLVNGCTIGVKCTGAQHEQNRRTEFKVISN